MTIDILTIFPEMFESVLNSSILGRARAQGLITIEATDIRPFSASKHKNTDDYPYGGGAGMLMMAQPIADAMKAVCEKRGLACRQNTITSKHQEKTGGNKINCENIPECITDENSLSEAECSLFLTVDDKNCIPDEPPKAVMNTKLKPVKRIYLSPRGVPLTQKLAQSLAQEKHIILLCGHYEGVDQRVLDQYIDMEVSIGDYVLTGGELGAMVLADCVARLIPGVLGSEESPQDESFSDVGLLEYPQYTRPRVFEGMEVPNVLLNGDHAKIAAWRREQAILATAHRRPELLQHAQLTEKEMHKLGIEKNQ
ncbi:MAG: tRNA (guanosine(37)-N1)-methyltransferase TrmD [Clostridia bacterium]|nr:tRNA (guanosine(37)-N1)-methyltransferase TrmD [Clostridia bacterium]